MNQISELIFSIQNTLHNFFVDYLKIIQTQNDESDRIRQNNADKLRPNGDT